MASKMTPDTPAKKMMPDTPAKKMTPDTPAKKMWHEYFKDKTANPFNPREVIVGDPPIGTVSLSLREPHVSLDTIRTFEPRHGHGHKIMKELTSLADKHKVQVHLDPVPFGKKHASKRVLVKFYKSHGFTHKLDETGRMIRHPQGQQFAAAAPAPQEPPHISKLSAMAVRVGMNASKLHRNDPAKLLAHQQAQSMHQQVAYHPEAGARLHMLHSKLMAHHETLLAQLRPGSGSSVEGRPAVQPKSKQKATAVAGNAGTVTPKGTPGALKSVAPPLGMGSAGAGAGPSAFRPFQRGPGNTRGVKKKKPPTSIVSGSGTGGPRRGQSLWEVSRAHAGLFSVEDLLRHAPNSGHINLRRQFGRLGFNVTEGLGDKHPRVSHQKVDVGTLIPTQLLAHVEGVIKHRRGRSDPIDVLKRDGKHYIQDGHHRALVALSSGLKKIHAKIHDYD